MTNIPEFPPNLTLPGDCLLTVCRVSLMAAVKKRVSRKGAKVSQRTQRACFGGIGLMGPIRPICILSQPSSIAKGGSFRDEVIAELSPRTFKAFAPFAKPWRLCVKLLRFVYRRQREPGGIHTLEPMRLSFICERLICKATPSASADFSMNRTTRRNSFRRSGILNQRPLF
jgi:hypothetical protein